MIKMLTLLFTLTAQAYANNYLHYHQNFRDSNSDILRSYEWKEELNSNAEIMAS